MPDFVAYRGPDNPLAVTQSSTNPNLSLKNYLLHIASPAGAPDGDNTHAFVTEEMNLAVFGANSAALYGLRHGDQTTINLISDVDGQTYPLEVEVVVNPSIVPSDYICIGMLLLEDSFTIGPPQLPDSQGEVLPLLAHQDHCTTSTV